MEITGLTNTAAFKMKLNRFMKSIISQNHRIV